jgi:hypothetical protein
VNLPALNTSPLATLILLVFLLLAVVAALVGLRRQRKANRQVHLRQVDLERRQRQAVWTGATVVSIRRPPQAGETLLSSGRLRVELRLQVNTPSGNPYQAATAWLIDAGALQQVQPGQELSVKVDAQDATMVYPNVSWAEYAPRE